MTNFPFEPTGNTVSMSASTATANASLGSWPYSGGGNVRVTNSSNNLAFIAFATSASGAVSTTTGMPILPNSVELFTVGRDQVYAVGVAGATATLYFTPGQGGI